MFHTRLTGTPTDRARKAAFGPGCWISTLLPP